MEEKGKRCFIITPIGNVNSDIFRKAKGVIESVIKPILEKNRFDDIKPAYEIVESGMIGNQIINRIINDDLVIANLTGNNPNVMYELAIRHVVAKPIIHICENGTILPFDIKDNRTIFYTNDMLGVQELKNEFERFVKRVNFSIEYKDNPIYNAIQMDILLRKMEDEGRKTEAVILQKILDEVSTPKKENNMSMSCVSPNVGYYDICMRCNGTDESFTKFEKAISNKIQAVPLYDEAKNIIGFNLYNNEPQDINQIYAFIYEIVKKCELQNVDFASEIKLI